MGIISPTLPTLGEDNATADVDVLNTLQALVNLVNGSIDDANIAPSGVTTSNIQNGAITRDKLDAALRGDVPTESAVGYNASSDVAITAAALAWMFHAGEPAQALAVPDGQTWLYQFHWSCLVLFDATASPTWSCRSGPVLLSSAGGAASAPVRVGQAWKTSGATDLWNNLGVISKTITVPVTGVPTGRWVRIAYARDIGHASPVVKTQSFDISVLRRVS